MLFKYLSLSLLLLALIAATALADGGFYGTITYKNCDCTSGGGDRVKIQKLPGGVGDECVVDCWPCCGYNTEADCLPHTFSPGTYRLWVDLHEGTDSCATVIKIVEHGEELQEVNLVVNGPPDEPNSPGGD